jgi:hypothetical protein
MSTKSLDKRQLKKLLLVALSSDQPGEVMAALGRVKGALAKAGLDVHWLTDTLTVAPVLPLDDPFTRWAHQQPVVAPWQDMLGYCGARPDRMSPREQDFVMSLLQQWGGREYWHPTERQLQWLTKIYTRVKGP